MVTHARLVFGSKSQRRGLLASDMQAAKNAFQMDVEEEDVPEGQGAGAGQAAGSGAEQGAADGAAAGGDAATAASARPSVIRSRRPIAPGLAGSGGGGAGR